MNRKARARLAARKKASRPDRFIEDGYSHWKFSKGKSASPESKIENVDIPADEISQLTSSDEEDGDEDLSASGGGQAPVAHSDPTLVADFDPSQPRDKGGKWSKEGGSGGEGFHRKTLAGISDKFRGEVLDYVKKQGWDEKEFEHRLDHEVHRLKTARAAAPERYSSADHEAVVKDVMGQVMSQMRTEARQKEAEDFKKLRAEKLAQPVPSPPSVGASTAQVQILSKRTPEKVEEHVRKVLGEHATMQDVASLAGAAHGAVVTVSPGKGASSLTVRVKHPDYVSKRTIYKDENGNLVLHNDEFFMKPGSTGKGLGAEVFGRQVEHAQRLGVSHIETLAGGPPAMNGYYTWPRFGYDQHLDSLSLMSGRYGDQKIRAAREKFPGVESVSDIFLHHGGAEWWKTNGLAMPEATFDLKPGSRSLKVWHSYLAEKVSSRSSSSEPVSHSSQLVEDVALMVNVNPRYDPLDLEIDDIGNGEENYDFSPEVETDLNTAWEKLREELAGKSPVAHFGLDDDLLGMILENLDLASNAVAGPNPWAPYVGKRGGRGWKNGITGRVAYQLNQPGLGRRAAATPAGTGAPTAPVSGQPRAQRANPTDVKNHITKLLSDPSKITAADIHKVREDLLSMTVAQIHGVRKDLGLKASGVKKDLADKVATRALAGLGKTQTQPQTPAPTPTPPQHQPPAPAQHPTPAATPVQPAAAGSPSPLHRGANVITGTPAQAPMASPVVPHKEEIEWSTGKPEPGTLHGVDFAPAPHHFWEHVKDRDIGEPAPTRPINRAGVMIQEPDGRIWIVRPTNEFGDRKHTLPGGGVETGLTHQQNALKEVWEETGLQVEITGHLGDFRDSNNGNNGRLYIGRRIGGAPWDAKIEPHIIDRKTGKPSAESSEVLLVTPERAGKLLHRSDDLAQLMTVAPIPLSTATRGRGSEPLKKLLEAVQPAAKAYKDARQAVNATPGNAELHAIQDIRGFNAKPTVVSKNDMDALVAKGDHIEVLRGLSANAKPNVSARRVVDTLAEQFRTGDHYPGYGIFGSGTYTDSTKGSSNIASQYASGRRGSGGSDAGATLRMAIPKDAKIVKFSELQRQVPHAPPDFTDHGPSSYAPHDDWRGIHAALAGYDAIHMDNSGYGHDFYVILNRGVVTVQKEDATGHVIR